MKKFFIILLFGLFFVVGSLSAQNNENVISKNGTFSNDKINPESFNNELFQELMLKKVNYFLDSLNFEGFESESSLGDAAKKHAEEMAAKPEASVNMDAKSISDRLIRSGGSGIGSELTTKITIRISNEYITYNDLAQQILSRWSTGKSFKELSSQKYFFAGVSAKIENAGKKIFVAMFMGNFNSFKTPSTIKAKGGLKPYDEKFCKKATSKMPAVVDLQSGITIDDNNNIIFTYNNLKKFAKLIKDKKDGLAVDIVEKSKYEDCNSQQVPNNETKVTIGIPTKAIFSKKLYKNNLAEGEGKRNKVTKLKVNLGQIPANFANLNDYEYNLLIIKGKRVCEDIPQSYVDKKILNYVPKITLLPDTIEIAGPGKYVPIATSTQLKFRINFEKGKYEYKAEEMKPIIEALNEPDFIINKILIEAYSSLEGTEQGNTNLQKQRAASIVKAFEKHQNASIVDSIVTSSSYEELKKDVKSTVFAEDFENLNYAQAVEYVNKNTDKMEIILAQHRYANITIWVTYNTEGKNEQRYVVTQFNKAVAADSLVKALAIQKYLMKRVIESVYNEDAVTEMKIPQGKQYVGLNMNKIWLTQYVFLEPLDEEYLEKIEILNQLDNKNIYVEYNDVVCKIELSNLLDEQLQDKLQRRIDRLYNTSIGVNFVDLLNIELQCQIMNTYKDSLSYESPIMVKCLTKIKEIIHFDEIKWENALKLATIFIVHNDYEYAARLLEPWITKENVPFEILSTYLTVCSKIPNKFHSNRFISAAQKIINENPSYFCELFKGDKLSKQIFSNLKIKDLYCKSCIKK